MVEKRICSGNTNSFGKGPGLKPADDDLARPNSRLDVFVQQNIQLDADELRRRPEYLVGEP